jgi:hypothetical protein
MPSTPFLFGWVVLQFQLFWEGYMLKNGWNRWRSRSDVLGFHGHVGYGVCLRVVTVFWVVCVSGIRLEDAMRTLGLRLPHPRRFLLVVLR